MLLLWHKGSLMQKPETKAAMNNDKIVKDFEKTHSTGQSEDILKKFDEKPGEETQSFKCDQCDKNASCKTNLRKHGMTKPKEPVTPITFKCDVCKEHLDTKNYPTYHMVSVHDHPEEPYYCDLFESVTSIILD